MVQKDKLNNTLEKGLAQNLKKLPTKRDFCVGLLVTAIGLSASSILNLSESIDDPDALFIISLYEQNLSYWELKEAIFSHFNIRTYQDLIDLKYRFLSNNFVFDFDQNPQVGLTFFQFVDYKTVDAAFVRSFAPLDTDLDQVAVKKVQKKWSGRDFFGVTVGMPSEGSIVILDLDNTDKMIENAKEVGLMLKREKCIENTVINEIAHVVFNENYLRFQALGLNSPQFGLVNELYSDYLTFKYGHYLNVEIVRLLNSNDPNYQVSQGVLRRACEEVLGFVPSNRDYPAIYNNTQKIVDRFLELSESVFEEVMQ